MIVAGFLKLPDIFVAGVIFLILSLFFIGREIKRHRSGHLRVRWVPLVVLVLATFFCLGEASTVTTSNGKLAVVGSDREPYPRGLQFKPPWESVRTYDDVIATAPISSYPSGEVPMSREISLKRDFTWSYAAEKKVDSSYLLAKECIRKFNDLIAAGQSATDEYTCHFEDKSALVFRN